jgi:hypothetical protein
MVFDSILILESELATLWIGDKNSCIRLVQNRRHKSTEKKKSKVTDAMDVRSYIGKYV